MYCHVETEEHGSFGKSLFSSGTMAQVLTV